VPGQNAGLARRRPAHEVADVFRAHGEAYRQAHRLSGGQLQAMRAIESCRTEQLGGHLEVCPDEACGFERPAYNSCRNRHCPKCQSLAQARWVEQRLATILPVHHFHVVFTLPAELRALARQNRCLIFKLLFEAASQTLLELGDDPSRLGARLGLTAVLHTWTRKIEFHPHLHCIVTGGGLAPAGDHWLPLGRRYLFPVKVLGALFRGKFLAGLRRLRQLGQLDFSGPAARLADETSFARLLDRLYQTNWVVYAKRPFAGPQHVFRYLGRYTHRVALSNQRIQHIDRTAVRFATKDGEAVSLPPEVFIRRFLDHVLPPGFTKIRHFGLYASSNVHAKLPMARACLAAEPSPCGNQISTPTPKRLPWYELLHSLTGHDPRCCPRCGQMLLHRPLPRRPAVPKTVYHDTS